MKALCKLLGNASYFLVFGFSSKMGHLKVIKSEESIHHFFSQEGLHFREGTKMDFSTVFHLPPFIEDYGSYVHFIQFHRRLVSLLFS